MFGGEFGVKNNKREGRGGGVGGDQKKKREKDMKGGKKAQ